MFKRIGAVSIWFCGLAFVFAGFNINDPYLISLRGWGRLAIVAADIAVVVWLLRANPWCSRSIAAKLLVLLWCLPPLALLSAHESSEWRKRHVLSIDSAEAHRLGRHFVVGYSSFDEAAVLADKGLIAGIYVSRRNIAGKTAGELKAEIAALQEHRRAARLPPLIVAADQEGGIVSHLSPQLTKLPALSTLADLPPERGAKKAEEFGRVHGQELADLGISLNFAPVLDLRPAAGRNRFDFNTLIGQRAISGDPATVASIALAYTRGLDAVGVSATAKHFPGLGRVRADTHHFRADLDTPLAELEASDWRPFRHVLERSSARLMVGHVTLMAIDPDHAASHSKRVVDGVIRKKWNYQGVIITDDLVMGAIYQHGICAATSEALNASVDLLLVAYDGSQFYRIFQCAHDALVQGRLDAGMLQASEARLQAPAQKADRSIASK
jgi:beta-N-acetylhexosaminidase